MKLSWKDCLKIGVSIFVLYLCIHFWPGAIALAKLVLGASAPLIIGCAVAYVVNILMAFYECIYFPRSKQSIVLKTRRPVCMVGAFATLVAAVVLIVALIVPQLVSCVRILIAKLPDAIDAGIAMVESLNILPEDILRTLDAIDWRSKLGDIVQAVTSGIGNVVDVLFSAVSSVFSGVVTGLLSFIFSIYLLSSKEDLGSQFHLLTRRYLPDDWRRKLEYVIEVVDDCFHRYIVGQCLEAVIIGVLCAVGMAILRLPYATMIGALVGFTALIPVAGAYIGAAVGAFMILTESPIQAVIFLIFLVVLQQLEGNLIYPRVVGSSMGLPGIWVLAAVTVGGGIMGVGGMLLGVPLAAAAYRIIRDDVAANLPAAESEAEPPAEPAPAPETASE